MKRGIRFEIPNEYGDFLGIILKPIDIAAFSWQVGSEESYTVTDGRVDEELFLEDKKVMTGIELKSLIQNNRYYLIFADLKAFPKGKLAEIKTYEEFKKSECEIVLLVTDSCYVEVYCKDQHKIESLFKNAQEFGFEDISHITDENDGRTWLSL